VLDTLTYLRHETDVWFEVTTLLIPGRNDSDEEIARMVDWYLEHLGPSVPLHFTAFHPDYKLNDLPPTPPATLRHAREIAQRAGLKHVYTGNIVDTEGGTTYCAGCGETLIVRDWHEVTAYHLDAQGCCPHCGQALAGRFGHYEAHSTRRRQPVYLGTLR